MIKAVILPFRVLGILWTLARCDAFAVLEDTLVNQRFLRLVRRLAAPDCEGRPGERLCRALTLLGPVFIKFGQFLATRADLIGDTLAQDLSRLQDRLPPFSSTEAKRAVERSLGRPLDKLFLSFDEEPVSAASLAQVHFATIERRGWVKSIVEEPSLEGETESNEAASEDEPGNEGFRQDQETGVQEVAVKILRPGVEREFLRDIDLLAWGAAGLERIIPLSRRFRPVESVALFRRLSEVEMDLRLEAAAASELAENFVDDPTYRIPRVEWDHTAQRVLTMERVSGVRLDDREALLAAGHDLTQILENAAAIFFNQVFRDGFFHGDQHPGNMWVDAEGGIVVVDFGIMGRLDQKLRFFLADMLLATLARDYKRLAHIHVEAGFLPSGQPEELFSQALRAVCEPIFGRPLAQISFARLLGQILQITASFQMPVQPQLLLMQKNMLMAEGISRQLDDSLTIWMLAEPLITQWVAQHRGPQAKLREAGAELGALLERAPQTLRRLERMADSAETLLARSAERPNGGLSRSSGLLWLAVALLALIVLLD